jgi:malonyl-CoA O-methyltransferase
MTDTAQTLSVLDAYELWAPTYSPWAHNPLMRAEQCGMERHWPEVAGRRTLDLACGTGRYAARLVREQAAQVVGLDLSPGMLQRTSAQHRVRADMSHLPFAARSFDFVVCGLAIGHAPSIEAWMQETARVLDRRGILLYSDFHPEAVRAGLARTFKDASQQTRVVPHQCYELAVQLRAAQVAQLTIEAVEEVRVGIELTEPFAGSGEFYRRWHGLPLVLIGVARKH